MRVRVGAKLEIARASVLALERPEREPHGRVCPSVYLTRYLAQALGLRTTALRVIMATPPILDEASDSSALVALRFPAKPKRAAGDRKRVPLRERMAAAELR